MRKSFLGTCFAAVILIGLISCQSVPESPPTAAAAGKVLSKAEETRVRRFLHPLPQELRLAGRAYEIGAGNCAILDNPDASQVEKQMISDFRAKWLKKRGTALKSENGELTIVAGLLKNSPKLRKAAENGLFDAKYLAERRNPEQAYVLKTVSEGGKPVVYLVANESSGLYYGLLTLDQLLDGLSKKNDLVLPHCHIVDWPDIRMRGSWVAINDLWTREKDEYIKICNKRIVDFAALKYNFIEALSLSPNKTDENGELAITWKYPKEIIRIGEDHAVTVVPCLGHIPSPPLRNKLIKKMFPGAKGTNFLGQKKGLVICHSHPDTRKFLTEWLVAAAREFDSATVWMSETESAKGVCHCEKCKGEMQTPFIKETKVLMDAYRAAKKVNPKFQIILGLTQGTYPNHHAMLKHIPKDIPLNFYSGIMTYKSTFQKYNLPPSVQEMRRQGYTVGSIPSPNPWGSNIFGPFQTPQYVRQLCGEAEERGLDFVDAYLWPQPFFFKVNAEAMAEFLWNSNGRTAKEFTTAWATRQGLKNPEEVAEVIDMLEYPERAFRNCGVWVAMNYIVDFMLGKSRPSRTLLRRGFEFPNYDEVARCAALCQEAKIKAAKLDCPELIAASEVMSCAMSIMERYTSCFPEGPNKAPADKEKVLVELKKQIKLYPELFEKWLALKKPSIYTRRAVDYYFVKKWNDLLEQLKKAKVSEETRKLLAALKNGKVKVDKLSPEWSFQTSNDDLGLKQKWFAAEYNDSTWSTIKAGLGYGWEKQGHDGHTGHAWYRRQLKLPKNMVKAKHVYLLFEGVDEDAEVYVNGKKVFTHDYKTVGGSPACTWNLPFSIDVKSELKAGTDNTLAVRVYNRMGMGGIWQPISLISTETPAKTEDLKAVAQQHETDSFNPLYD